MSSSSSSSSGIPQPSVFLSHGTPMLGLASEDDRYVQSLQAFVRGLPDRPKAIVALSAHGLSGDGIVEISAVRENRVHHDFTGFPPELYQLQYSCPGSPELATRVASLLAGAGFETALKTSHRLDHGVWLPLKVAFPQGDIPVVQISLPYPTQSHQVLKLGKALASLRQEGVLILGTGGAVHNLERLVWHGKSGPAAPWATEFEAWVLEALQAKDVDALLHYEQDSPQFRLAHPSPEHFLPILFTVGAALPGDQAFVVHRGIEYVTLSMLSFVLSPSAGSD